VVLSRNTLDMSRRDLLTKINFVARTCVRPPERSRTVTERERCGWCIAGDHEHCVVVVEMRGARRERRYQQPVSYLWRCGCWCRDPDGPAPGGTLRKAEGRAPG
jgi:hypothetical protein